MACACLAAPATAGAGLDREFSVFSQCPVNAPGVTECVYSTTTGGEFKIGSRTVPINHTIVLQGGVNGADELIPAADGETLSRTPLVVPGGLIGIEILGNLGEVTATAELAGTVHVDSLDLISRKGTAVSLPLKVKLDNPLLGGECYVGSAGSPVSPQLTSGTTAPPPPNTPISGTPGTVTVMAGGKIAGTTGASLVDNAFGVPGATGCGGLLSLLVDPSVDLATGIPAAPGHNAAVLDGSLEQTSATALKIQRSLPQLGRCVKAPSERVEGTTVYHGLYANAGCTIEEAHPTGRYEWEPGVGAAKTFAVSGRALSLEAVGRAKVTCKASSGSGEYTGTQTATMTLTLAECVRTSTRETCQSAAAAPGEIRLGSLAAQLGFISDAFEGGELKVAVGWDLSRSPAIVSATCGAAAKRSRSPAR